MRHIPEEELHAYLDQALSRAQAVEIESHLAECARCRAERDGIAGLRDRTTALLATLAPRGAVVRPSWGELRRRHLAAEARRANLLRGAVWAASLLAAIGLGYGAHSVRDAATVAAAAPRPATPRPGPETPIRTDVPASVALSLPRRPVSTGVRPVTARAVQEVETDTLTGGPSVPTRGVWRTESLERVMASGLTVPRVAGLPVLQIQIQDPESPAATPVVAVDQQLTSGELLRTFVGPARQVAALDSSAVASDGASGWNANSTALRIGNRMYLMTGRIPPDSLRALLARIPTK